MTAIGVRATATSQVHATQNTAPVLEFRCLYTHDLRRKAKRWQDGNLRYHTFNKRVMVYDLARSFIGDTYIPQGSGVDDGDEFELEKHGALVQVSEPIGQTQTDLTELMQSRTKKPPVPSPARVRSTHAGAVQKHKSLTALLGSSGPPGRATLPTTSPFEERQKRRACEWQSSSKRRRLNDGDLPAVQTTPTRAPRKPDGVASDRRKQSRIADEMSQANRDVIDLVSQEESVIDNTINSSIADGSALPAQETGAPPSRKLRPVEASGKRQVSNSVLSTKTNGKEAQGIRDDSEQLDSQKRQPLRVISNAPRKMMLCQSAKEPSLDPSKPKKARDGSQPEQEELAPHQQRLRDRIARIGQRRKRNTAETEASETSALPQVAASLAHDRMSGPDGAVSYVSAQDPQVDATTSHREHSVQPSIPLQVSADSDRNHETTTRPALHHVEAETPKQPDQGVSPSMVAQGASPEPAIGIVSDLPAKAQERACPASKKAVIGRKTLPTASSMVRSQSDPAKIEALAPERSMPPPASKTSVEAPAAISIAKADPAKARARSKSAQAAMPAPTKPVDPLDSGPWSREAFDLFDWWPPDRDKNGVKKIAAAA